MSEIPTSSEKPISVIHEISISDIISFISKYAFKTILLGLSFGIAGYAVSFLLPVVYSSYSTLLPESGTASNGMGSLSGLARLSGLTKNESGGALQPELYPAILQTAPFCLYILNQPVIDENNHSYKSFRHFLHRNDSEDSPLKEDVSVGKYNKEISKKILSLSKSEEKNIKFIESIVTTLYDLKTEIITISAETDDPVISAQLVQASSNYLIQYVSDYRTEKTNREVQFLGQRVAEAKTRQQNAEYALQSYRDRNRNAFLNVARIEEQRLQSDYVLAQSLYSDIIRKWEEAKIKVKEQQPVIKILEPARIPTIKSKPKRLIITLIFTLVGTLLYLCYIFFFRKNIK